MYGFSVVIFLLSLVYFCVCTYVIHLIYKFIPLKFFLPDFFQLMLAPGRQAGGGSGRVSQLIVTFYFQDTKCWTEGGALLLGILHMYGSFLQRCNTASLGQILQIVLSFQCWNPTFYLGVSLLWELPLGRTRSPLSTAADIPTLPASWQYQSQVQAWLNGCSCPGLES